MIDPCPSERGHYKVSNWQSTPRLQEELCHLHQAGAAGKANGTTVHVCIHTSKVVITRLKLDKDCKKIPERKAKSRQIGKGKGRYKKETNEKMQE